mgnify:FL=1|jgi:excisionase family DNA binding protein|tara:strand:- start:195 stop:428 length:234 start_codon:yes stop_codon:yes gene_type:complete
MTEQLVLLSVKEVAQLLGVDRATIGSWNHAGRLPNPEWTVSGGRTPIWTEDTIKDWANSDEFVQSKLDGWAKNRLEQ